MYLIRAIFLLIAFVAAGVANSATICAYQCIDDFDIAPGVGVILVGGGSGPLEGGDEAMGTLFVEGNLFIDFSVFSYETGRIDIATGTEVIFSSQNIVVYGDHQTPIFPSTHQVALLNGGGFTISNTGDLLLFGITPLTGGVFTFTATGDIHVGNYSALSPVPIPAAIWLFLSAVLLPVLAKRKLAK